MPYPTFPDLHKLIEDLKHYAELKHEYGSKGIAPKLAQAERALRSALRDVKALPEDRKLAAAEPDDLDAIRALRPRGPRRLWDRYHKKRYPTQIEGALMARCAGNILGAIVELYPIWRMKHVARLCGDEFPPTRYWSRSATPFNQRYQTFICESYTRGKIDGVPVDDDLAYTQVGLLILEEYGLDFTTADVGEAWRKYLPMACTAEDVALKNLKAGIAAKKAAEKDNPYCQWIGADIRADPWGYVAPGWPEKAAELAYRDAYLSHRRNGIYGEMFFAAAIAAAFAVDDPIEAIRIGLTEIPRDCTLAKDVKWALKVGPTVKDHQQARDIVDKRFKGMHPVHTNNNAALTIFGLFIGGTDVTKVIGQTVAMGLDNDCTAATAGSLVGAVVGGNGVPKRWTRGFNNKMHSYLKGNELFAIDDLLRRFAAQAEAVHATTPADGQA